MSFKLPPEMAKALSFKLTPEMKKKVQEAFPLPFPEIWEWMQLPLERVVQIMQKHIRRLYKNGGIENVLRFRDECEKERNQVQNRLDKKLPNDDTIHLETVIHYFDIFIAQINAVKGDLERENQKPTYADMREHLVNFYSENEEKLGDEYKSGKGIADHLVSHLKKKFPNADKYPSESTIRKDWLELTS